MDVEGYRSILSNAIDREIEAYTFYRTLQEKVRDENLKNLLDELAGEEIKHRKTLEAFLLKEPGELGFNTERDYKVADTLETPPLSADLKPIDGLVIAIRKELDAMQMYTQLASLSVDPEQPSCSRASPQWNGVTRRAWRISTPTWRSRRHGERERHRGEEGSPPSLCDFSGGACVACTLKTPPEQVERHLKERADCTGDAMPPLKPGHSHLVLWFCTVHCTRTSRFRARPRSPGRVQQYTTT